MANPADLTAAEVVAAARRFGADLAGVAALHDLQRSPSHAVFPKLDRFAGVGTAAAADAPPGEVRWPDGMRSVVVLAVAHPAERPELDWWRDDLRGGTAGNQQLMAVVDALAPWLRAQGADSVKLPYHVERGGLFLKDAAVLAGLGCVGRNNLFLAPGFGPRVRLRALAVSAALEPTRGVAFDPCAECPAPCRAACPQQAFASQAHDPRALGQHELPGRDGHYDRLACNVQMNRDVAAHQPIPVPDRDAPGKLVRHCRRCELSCLAGRVRGKEHDAG